MFKYLILLVGLITLALILFVDMYICFGNLAEQLWIYHRGKFRHNPEEYLEYLTLATSEDPEDQLKAEEILNRRDK